MRFLSWNQINQVLINKNRQNWSPTVFSSSGAPSSYTINEATYVNLGNTVSFYIDFTVNNASGASGDRRFSLPIASVMINMFRVRKVSGTSGTNLLYQGMILASSTTAVFWRYDNNSSWANGDRYVASGEYRIG